MRLVLILLPMTYSGGYAIHFLSPRVHLPRAARQKARMLVPTLAGGTCVDSQLVIENPKSRARAAP